jgi:pimeloyl-ACP methyl ester carboxylesterase
MPTHTINGVHLYLEELGDGEPLVLVHGSWVDHHAWDLATPLLAGSFHVVSYDRRGHSQSERPSGQGSVRDDAGDLAALIEHLDLGPAHVAGNSFGASIALRMAGDRPELVRTLSIHEPPLFGLLADDAEAQPILAEVRRRMDGVGQLLMAGDDRGAAERFVEEVALGPGQWQLLPPEVQAIFINNAPTFADESRDPEGPTIDLTALSRLRPPTQLSVGTESPPLFPMVAAVLTKAIPGLRTRTINGAGHVPHMSHPLQTAEMVRDFCLATA